MARATKGKGLIVCSGAFGETEVRAPRDVGNLCLTLQSSFKGYSTDVEMYRLTFLELKQDQTHDASTTTPKSLVLRARKGFC